MQTNILRSICPIIGGFTFAQTFVSLVSPKYPHWAWIVFAILCIASGVTYIICYRRDKKEQKELLQELRREWNLIGKPRTHKGE